MPLCVSRPRRVCCLTCLGGDGPVPFNTCPAWGCVPLMGARGRPGRSGAWGGGGGGGLCAVLPGGMAGEPRGAGSRSTSVRSSAFTGRATKQVSLALLRSWRAWPPHCSDCCSRVDPVRVRLPVEAPVGAGGWKCRGVWRTDLAASPPRAPRPSQQEGELPPRLVAVDGRRPRGPSPAFAGQRGGSGGSGEGGVAPWFLTKPLRGGDL